MNQLYEVTKLPKRRGKYNAQKTEFDGHVFDSKHEAAIAQQLKLLMSAKDPAQRIAELEYHPKKYDLIVNGVKVSHYTPDFRVVYADGRTEIIDAKSSITKKKNDYVIRKKLMKALYDIEIIEM